MNKLRFTLIIQNGDVTESNAWFEKWRASFLLKINAVIILVSNNINIIIAYNLLYYRIISFL